MIDLYYWPTPNGHKITIFLEEAGIDYKIRPVNIAKGDQFEKDFLEISPNNKMPAIVDHHPLGGDQPLALFESGAILEYLADKSGKFLAPQGTQKRYNTLKWLHWQIGGLGPMAGQNHHFSKYADEKIPYAIERYQNETTRLYKVLNKQLEEKSFVAGDEFSIADMAIYPWIVPYDDQGQSLDQVPNVPRWFEEVRGRPAVKEAYAKGEAYTKGSELDDAAKKVLFGQKGDHLR